MCIASLVPGAGVSRVWGIKKKVVGPEDGMVTDLIPQDGFISAVAAFHLQIHLYLVQKSTWRLLLLVMFAHRKMITIAKRSFQDSLEV